MSEFHPMKPVDLGCGSLHLTIRSIRQLTPRIRTYELSDIQGQDLPLINAGAHLAIPVLLANGKQDIRYYSICSHPTRRDIYEIAVLQEEQGSGGSQFIYNMFTLGLQLHCEPPQNHFHLHADASPALFIAGGIGITPIKPMAQTLALRGRRFQLHYAGRSLTEMAFQDLLAHEFGNHFFAYPKDENKRLDIMHLLASTQHNAFIYVCGPRKLIDDVYNCATALGISKDRIQSEQFVAATDTNDKPVIVELARSNKLIQVTAEQSLLTAVRDAGVKIGFDCCVGDCGTCATKVITGDVEHRDHVLSDAEKAKGLMCLCVSRARGEKLVLDL
jgi:ferredoxin-NADP reductase